MTDGKLIQLGQFDDKEKAVAKRKDAEIRFFGEFSPLAKLSGDSDVDKIEAEDTKLEEYVHRVNTEAARLDQQFAANAQRAVGMGATVAVAESAVQRLIRPELDVFVQLAGEHRSLDEVIKAFNAPVIKPVGEEPNPPVVEPNAPPRQFAPGEIVVTMRRAALYHLLTGTTITFVEPGTRLVYLRGVLHDPDMAIVKHQDREVGIALTVIEPASMDKPFVAGETVVVIHNTSAYRVDNFTAVTSFNAGTRMLYRRSLQRGISTFAVVTHEYDDVAVPMAMIDHAPPESPTPLEKPAASHTITIYTGRIDSDDPDMIDITIKSASTPEGRILAPLWPMVTAHKEGKLSDAGYTEKYKTLLRERYTTDKAAFLDILRRNRVVLCCYCSTKSDFCHRHLAVDILEAIAKAEGITVIRGGELVKTKAQEAAEQLVMF